MGCNFYITALLSDKAFSAQVEFILDKTTAEIIESITFKFPEYNLNKIFRMN